MKWLEVGAVIIVLALLALTFTIGFSNRSQHLSTRSANHVTKVLVAIQPETVNEICVIQQAELTTYLTSQYTGNPPNSTTTETTTISSTTTLYDNVTIDSNGSICTEINPHYNVTQTPACGPCV